MMFSKRHIRSYIGKLQPFFSLDKMVNCNMDLPFLPFYHGLGNSFELPHIRHLYEPSDALKFEADLDFILSKFKAISLDELILYSKKEIQFNRPVFHLSFDDGLRQVYEMALPILERKGIPATIFLNSNFVDNKELFFRYQVSLIIEKLKKKGVLVPKKLYSITDKNSTFLKEIANQNQINFNSFLEEYQPYMSTNQLNDWIARGFSLGGHSIDHPYYHLIDETEQKRQTVESVDYIHNTFGTSYKAFAFPFSDAGVSNHLLEDLHQNNGLDISFGTSGVKGDSLHFHFQRIGMEMGNKSAAAIIFEEYLYNRLSGFLGKNVRRR